RALHRVVRDDAEEARRGLAVRALRQRRARRGRGDVRDARGVERLARGRDGARGRRAENGHHLLVGDVLLRERRGERGVELRVAGEQADLQAVLLGERLDRVLRPAELLLAEEPGVTGQRGDERDLERAATADAGRLLRRRGG